VTAIGDGTWETVAERKGVQGGVAECRQLQSNFFHVHDSTRFSNPDKIKASSSLITRNGREKIPEDNKNNIREFEMSCPRLLLG
jgi:hypothetical protein